MFARGIKPDAAGVRKHRLKAKERVAEKKGGKKSSDELTQVLTAATKHEKEGKGKGKEKGKCKASTEDLVVSIMSGSSQMIDIGGAARTSSSKSAGVSSLVSELGLNQMESPTGNDHKLTPLPGTSSARKTPLGYRVFDAIQYLYQSASSTTVRKIVKTLVNLVINTINSGFIPVLCYDHYDRDSILAIMKSITDNSRDVKKNEKKQSSSSISIPKPAQTVAELDVHD